MSKLLFGRVSFLSFWLLMTAHALGQAPNFSSFACPGTNSISITVTSPGAGAPYTYNLTGCGTTINQPGQPSSYTFTGIPLHNCFSSITVTDNAGNSTTRSVYMGNILYPGVERVYTYPCGPGTYVIIPVGGISTGANPSYTLYASNGTTILMGPQSSNVFANIVGNPGDNFVVGIRRSCGGESVAPVSLGTSTVINGRLDCSCTSGVPPYCSGVGSADLITGATYTWTGPNGVTYNGPSLVVPAVPENNGVWQLNTSITTGSCTYSLDNNFTLINCLTVLPVKFNYVRINSSNCNLKVSWSVAHEENTDKYEIETSTNGISDWFKIATVKSAGPSSTDKEYKIELPWTAPGKVYTRIKEVDKDGRFTFSKIILADLDCNSNIVELSVSPNPIQENGSIVLKIAGDMTNGKSTIIINDLLGRQTFIKTVLVSRTMNQFNLALAELPKGMYFVKMVGADGIWRSNTIKLMVQ